MAKCNQLTALPFKGLKVGCNAVRKSNSCNILALQMNLTATAPACRRMSTLLQTQMITSPFTSIVADIVLMSSLDGAVSHAPKNSKTHPGAKDSTEFGSDLRGGWSTGELQVWDDLDGVSRQTSCVIASFYRAVAKIKRCRLRPTSLAAIFIARRAEKRGRLQRPEGKWSCRYSVPRLGRRGAFADSWHLWLGTCGKKLALLWCVYAKASWPRSGRICSFNCL